MTKTYDVNTDIFDNNDRENEFLKFVNREYNLELDSVEAWNGVSYYTDEDLENIATWAWANLSPVEIYSHDRLIGVEYTDID